MLIDAIPVVQTVKVNPSFAPPNESFPHYRLLPIQTEAGKYHCLLFYVTAKDYLMLVPKIKRHLAIKKLEEYLKTATFSIYEIVDGKGG